MMKHNMKKIISLVLVLAMSFAISVPGFAAEKESTSQLKNEVVLQRKTGTETIKLPTGISVAELTEMKNNIQKYGNQTLSQEEIAHINAKAAASGGLVYGPWFGGYDSYYAMSPTETMQFALVLNTIISPILTCSYGAAYTAASYIADLIGYTLPVQPGQWIEADRRKSYREVKYSDGTFAYYQTKIGTSCTLDDSYLGYGEAIISGGMW
ncbi:hypothetical protein ACRQU7_18640 [Caproiciproducens sp. R1]|uniref:hypothetical protein n=1 Tax=Caproiciproducens sp. R1 TaxID=3435000 RepID=UPI00403468C8